MILEQNYRKIAEYTQKSFVLYSRRYLANLMLQILQRKQNIKEVYSPNQQINRGSKILFRDSQIEIQNTQKERETQPNKPIGKTIKNIDNIDKDIISTEISYLKYKDIVYLEVYNQGMNPSDPSQRLRVYSQLQTLKYGKLSQISQNFLNQKRSLFQIINPYNLQNQQNLYANSIFCLKNLFTQSYLSFNNQLKFTQSFGYQIQFNHEITPSSFLSFKGLQSKNTKIVTFQPLGLKISSLYLKAQGFQISCNIQGTVFYFNKVSGNPKLQQAKFVKIKNISTQKYLSSPQIQTARLMNKKTYPNVTIEDQNGVTIKQNQLIFPAIDFNKVTQTQISLTQFENSTLKNVWILYPTNRNCISDKNKIRIINACSGKFIIVKSDKTLKASSNYVEAAQFNILQTMEKQKDKNKHEWKVKEEEKINQDLGVDLVRGLERELQKRKNVSKIYQFSYQEWNVTVRRSQQETQKYKIRLNQMKSIEHYKSDWNQLFQFQVTPLSQEETHLLQQLIEIALLLAKVYTFLEKLGFIFDERNESLRFCVQEINKSNHQILYHNQLLNSILTKIHHLLHVKPQADISHDKIKDYLKQLKILQTLISITKIINLKIGHKKYFTQGDTQKDTLKAKTTLSQEKLKMTQSPFQVCQKYFQTIQWKTFQLIHKIIIINQKCSSVIIQQSTFFNKLLMINPQKIGPILHEAIRNLSLFTTKASGSQCNELFQWAKLIEPITEENVRVQKNYIDIIAQVVIDPKDRGIAAYQNKCRQLLFNQRNKKKLISRFCVEEEKPTIIFQTTNTNQFLYVNPILFQIQAFSTSQACFFIQDFFTTNFDKIEKYEKNQNYVQYILSIVKLFRNLCKDRNKKLLKVADDYGLDKKHIISCLNSNKIDYLFKMQYLLLYSVIFIDQDPFLPYERREVKCHIWNKIKEYNLQNKMALVFKQYTDLTTAVQKLKDFDTDVVPFIQSYISHSKKSIQSLFNSLKEVNDKWKNQLQKEMEAFKIYLHFLFQAINFGYLNIHHMKRLIYFMISHFQGICNLIEFLILSDNKAIIDEQCLRKNQEQISEQILKILELNQSIWIDINCINLVKNFQKDYSERKNPMRAIQLTQFCWKLLNFQVPLLLFDETCQTVPKNAVHLGKKKTTTKNMTFDEIYQSSDLQKLNNVFDQQIGKFLLRMIMVLSPISESNSYKKVIEVIQKRERRNINMYNTLSSFLIINGKKQQNIYRDYSGRVGGKILNVNRIYQLVYKIKASQQQSSEDLQNHKKIKQKLLQLNNLINKIRRDMIQLKEDDMNLFNKIQQIISKLSIDTILLQIVRFSEKPIYLQCVSNLNKFYLEFIWQNEENKKKLSSYLSLFLNNLVVQKCSLLISQLYMVLSQSQKKKYVQFLFDRLHVSQIEQKNLINQQINSQKQNKVVKERQNELIRGKYNKGTKEKQSNLIKQAVLETLFRIMTKSEKGYFLSQIKSQLAFQLFKQTDIFSLFTIDTNLSLQYINVLCQLGSTCFFVHSQIRKLYPKTTVKNLLYNQEKYTKKSVILKLFFYFYVKDNRQMQVSQVEELIVELIEKQIQHLPSVCQYLALQNLQTKENESGQRKYKDSTSSDNQQDIIFLKNKFQDLILYQHNPIQPSQQQKYWNFIYNTQDQNQMSLINFTIQVLKIQTYCPNYKSSLSKRINKSMKYSNFIEYLSQLCEFLKQAFKKNTNSYQRKVLNKLEQILIMNEERNQRQHKTISYQVDEEDRQFLRIFFDEISKIIIKEDISYAQIIECGQTNSIQLGKRRGGLNMEKMIMVEEFISFIQKIGKKVSNFKQFNRVLNQKKLTRFFNIYRSTKLPKINILKFLQKLFQYLQSIKNSSIIQINSKNLNTQNQPALKSDCMDFTDGIYETQQICTHFQSYYLRYEVILKLFLQKRWLNNQQKYFQLLILDMNRQSINSIPQIKTHNRQNFLSSYYLSKMCVSGLSTNNYFPHQNQIHHKLHSQTSILQIDLNQQKGSLTFSRILLLILKQLNQKLIQFTVDESVVRRYIRKKFELAGTESSMTLNQILMEMILNFTNTQSHKKNNQQPSSPINKIIFHSTSPNQSKLSQFQSINPQQNYLSRKSLAEVVYSQILSILQKKISLIYHFNFSYTLDSSLHELNYTQTHLPSNFKKKVQILSYGLTNGFIPSSKILSIQSVLMKILYLWALKRYSFSDLNWYTILHSIITQVDKHIENLSNFAIFLSNCPIYIERYCQLIDECCRNGVKNTNIEVTTKIGLLNLLSQFHFKFYLQDQKQSLGRVFNRVNFSLLLSSANVCFQESIFPKLRNFEDQLQCDLTNQQHQNTCTYSFCNIQRTTDNDDMIMETLVTLLIIIQLSISLFKKKYFQIPLNQQNQMALTQFENSLKTKNDKQKSKKDISCIQFYKKCIGVANFVFDQGSSITFHFKIPYLQKYCSPSFKEEVLYYLKTHKQNCTQKLLEEFSRYFQSQLQQRKTEQKIFLMPLVVSHKNKIQNLIIAINSIHVFLLIFSNLSVQIVFYPFTILFILFKLIFAFTDYKKAINIIGSIQYSKPISRYQKFIIFFNQKLFITILIPVLYFASFFIPNLFVYIVLLEIITVRIAFEIFILLIKTFVFNSIDILIFLGIVAVFFGIADWQNDWQNGQNKQFLYRISNVFREFYIFAVSNIKISTEYDFTYSKKYPLSFFIYAILIGIFIYRNLLFFIKEMKKEKDQIKQAENCCLICKSKKIDIQSEGQTFQEHVRFQHNIWHYLYFFIYLRRKQNKRDKLKKIQLDIKQRIKNKNYGFMKFES